MDPILPFIKMFKDNIISVTRLGNYSDNNQEKSFDVQNIEIRNDYVYFLGKEDVLAIPVDGATIDLDYENGETNIVTIFNEKYGYIKTKKFSF